MLKGLFQGCIDTDACEQIRVSLTQLMQQAHRAGWTAAVESRDILLSTDGIYFSEEEFKRMMDEIKSTQKPREEVGKFPTSSLLLSPPRGLTGVQLV